MHQPTITPQTLDLWRRVAQRIASTVEDGTLALLANAVLSLLSERERAEVALMQARDGQEPQCPARPYATGPCIESVRDPGRCTFCDQPMRNRAPAPDHLSPQVRLTFTARVAELERQHRELSAALGIGTHGSFRSIVARLERIELAIGLGPQRPEPTSIGVRLGRLETRASSLEKHAIEVEMLVRPENFAECPSSLPGLAQRVGMLETSVLTAGGDIAANLKRQTSPRRVSGFGVMLNVGPELAGAEPAPPAAEPHQPEPAGERDPHAICIGLQNGCPECLKANGAGPLDNAID